MRRTAILLLALLCPAPSHAAWGEKARACPSWATRLAELEQGGEDPASTRMQKLRNRIGSQCVALNEIQVLGSHNSFHIQPRPALFSLLVAFSSEFLAWEYTHLPLTSSSPPSVCGRSSSTSSPTPTAASTTCGAG